MSAAILEASRRGQWPPWRPNGEALTPPPELPAQRLTIARTAELNAVELILQLRIHETRGDFAVIFLRNRFGQLGARPAGGFEVELPGLTNLIEALTEVRAACIEHGLLREVLGENDDREAGGSAEVGQPCEARTGSAAPCARGRPG